MISVKKDINVITEITLYMLNIIQEWQIMLRRSIENILKNPSNLK
jgi:hypothetical protein